MNERTIMVSGIEVKFKATAAVPRLYRSLYNRDIFFDFDKLKRIFDANKGNKAASNMPVEILTIFEDIAFAMARHADPSIPATVDDWLEQFDMFSIYEIMPVIIELWADNMEGIAEAKKNNQLPNAR